MATTVVHLMRDEFDVRIDRRSKLGNPFHIGRDGDRETVVKKYAAWVIRQPQLLASLYDLKDKRLGCWCKPNHLCHGDVIVALLEDELRTPFEEQAGRFLQDAMREMERLRA